MAFQPKRMVNPFYIQLITAGFVTLIIIVANVHVFYSLEALYSFISASIMTLLISLLIFSVFGVLQLLLVRGLVGLVGTIDDLDRKTFLIDTDFQTVSDILLSDSFLDTWNLEKRKISKEMLEIYTSYSASWQIRLVLGRPAEQPNKSLLATVAFEKRFYTIFNSGEVSECRNDMIRRIESILGKEKLKPTDFNNTASGIALRSALNVTKPKTISGRTELGEVPSFYRNILILMGTIVAVVVGLFVFGYIPLDLFATSIIMVIIALSIELGPRLKEIMDAKKTEQ